MKNQLFIVRLIKDTALRLFKVKCFTSGTICRSLLCSLIITVSLAYGQTTYHISSSGNDSYPGTEAQPWKSMKKINSTTFNPGDAILFKRGDTFQGEISKTFNGTASQPIVIGAYGTGAKPIIYGDMTGAVWTKTPGHDGIYQAFAGVFTEGTGYEKQSGVWTLINKNNQGELHFYLYRPDSLNKFLNNLTKSTWGYGNDTVWIHTYDGNPPVVHIFHEASFIYGSYSIIQDLDFRNCWSALKTTNGRNLIWRNISTRNTMAPALFLCGNVRNCLVEYCTVDSAGYTALYDYIGGYRNIFRADTVRNVKSNILGLPKTFTEQCGIGLQQDTACVVENCVFYNLVDYALDSYMNHQDTARYNTIINTPGGMQLHGYEWIAHNNSITLPTNGSGFVVINYGTKQTTVYNNVIRNVTTGSGLKVSTRQSGTTVFYGNTVEAPNSYTFFDEFTDGGVTSTNNTFIGSGRFHSQGTSYSTLAAFQAAGFEAGSTINGSTYPIISTSTSSLSFGDVFVDSTSSEKTYIVQGSNLSPASGNITITAPTGYQVSVGSGMSSSLNVPYTDGTLSSKTIYVKFNPTVAQSYSGNITSAGGGAATKNVAVTGTGIPSTTPILTVNPTSLSFGNVIVHTNSNELTYTLTGSDLTPINDSLTITAPAGFTISTVSGSGYASSKRIPYTNGTVSAITIFVRFSPTAIQSYTSNITNTGGGTTTKNISVTGTGTSAPTPTMTVNPTSLSFGEVTINTASNERAYTLAGSNLSPAADSITITAPAGFTLSTVSGSGFMSSKKIAYTGGKLSATTIYVKFSPTAIQSYSGNINNIGGGMANKTVAVTGTGVSSPTPTLTVNTTSLSFGDVIINTTSSEQAYTLTGLNLLPAADSLTITAPTGFTISTVSGSGFASTKRIAYTGGVFPAITIFVRFSPAVLQDYTGNITCTGGGAIIKNIAVTGSGINSPSPAVIVNPESVEFSTVRINTLSSEKTYTVQGSYLSPESGDIAITAPAGYQVSVTSGSGFASSLNVPYTGSNLALTTIYIRFSPSIEQNYNGIITNVGGGAPVQNVAVSGVGIPVTSAALTINPTTLSFGDVTINTTSNELSYALTGLNLFPASDSLTITAPPGFTVSTVSGSGFISTKKIAYTSGMLQPIPKIIYVRFSPTAEQSYSDSIINSGGSAGTMKVHVSGNGISDMPAPAGTFTASSDTLKTRGDFITLTWTSNNASSASINNGIGEVAVNGSITKAIRSTTRFVLTLSNTAGSTSYAKTIYVKPRKLSPNKALYKPSTASSIELTGSEPNKANDGNISTRWSSTYVDNQWWQVDLQDITTIEDVSLMWDESYASQFTISTSLDGIFFADVATGYASGLDTTELNFDPINARYVRLTGIQRGTQFGISVFELGIYESAATATSVESISAAVPNNFLLEQNYPNPFNPTTQIGYKLSKTTEVQLVVYNILGKEIVKLVNKLQNAGHYTVTFNAKNLASGIYYARLNAEGEIQIRKMILLK